MADIEGLREGEALDLRPADYFYRLLALEPFTSLVKNENRARNLAILSQLLNTFQNYYHYTVVTYRNRLSLRFHLFNSFVRLLYDGGINEYEDPDQPFPKGHVQVMTIHQAKGLEFPVVVVGSLDKQLSTSKQIDRDLQPYYHRPPFEPESRITLFDRMRLHYVAFSRPEKLLVLTSHQSAQGAFRADLAGPATVAIRPAGSAGGPELRAQGPPAGEARLQFHWRSQGLRDVPTAVPVFPRVRLHTLTLGSHLLWPPGAPDH